MSFNVAYSQKLPLKPLHSELRSYNQSNLMKVSLGMKKSQVIELMGGIQSIQTYYLFCGPFSCVRRRHNVVNNPYGRDLRKGVSGKNIEIVWYYTDNKHESETIKKDELTPIVFENDEMVGLGWGFFEDYSKREELNININD